MQQPANCCALLGHSSYSTPGAQKRLVFFMMRKNSSSLTCPSPSLSASSIISWISSSVRFSPSSLATRLRFLNVMKPAGQNRAGQHGRNSSRFRSSKEPQHTPATRLMRDVERLCQSLQWRIRLSSTGPTLLAADQKASIWVAAQHVQDATNHWLSTCIMLPCAVCAAQPRRWLTCLVIIKQSEGLHDLLSRVSLSHLCCHHLQELLKVNGAAAHTKQTYKSAHAPQLRSGI